MERLIATHTELTGQAKNAYSSGRGIFMPDGNNSPDVSPRHHPIKHEVGHPAAARSEQMQNWMNYLGRENQSPDVARLVGALVDSELRPEHAALAFDPKSVTKAEKVLNGKQLTDQQKAALTAAHLVGDGKAGKDGGQAKIGNYKIDQIAQKARILKMGGFTPEEARSLMEAGVVGMYPPSSEPNDYDTQIERIITAPPADTRSTIAPDSFTDPKLKEIATKIQDFYSHDYLNRENLSSLSDLVNKRSTEEAGVSPDEARRLGTAIRKIMEFDDLRTGRLSRDRDRGTQIQQQDNELKRRISEAADPAEKARLINQRRKNVREMAKDMNVQSGQIPDAFFQIIIDEGNSLDYLVDRIISPPLDSETGDWSLGFYGQNNLDTIINILRTQRETGDNEEIRRLRNVQYNSVIEIEEAARLAHSVNKSIINADLKTFSAVAGSLDDVKLTRLSRVKGVGVVARLLEAEYGSLLARDGWVNSKNYATLFGKVKNPETGLLEANQQESALGSFQELVSNAKARILANPNDPTITEEMRELANLEEWQVVWAFNIGKSLYNMWLRGAEWISQGKVPNGDKAYVSFPQESIARILNWPQWMLQRFGISGSRGGTEWLKRAVAAHQAIREEQGYGHMGLSMIGGKKVSDFEMPDMVGVRGWWATWREKQLLMSTMPLQFVPWGAMEGKTIMREGVPVGPNDITNLGVLLDTGGISLNIGGENVSLGKAKEQIQVDYWKSIFLDSNGNVREDFKMGLGASLFFLKPHGEWDDKEHGELNKALDLAKNDIRKKIWEKAAEENPLGLIPYLHGLEYKGERDSISIVPKPNAPQAEKDAWRVFERKLFQLNEMKMQRIRGLDKALSGEDPNITRDEAIRKIKAISLSSIIMEENGREEGIKLDEDEIRWLEDIKNKGRDAAPHLANVRFEYNPFLNDTPFEKLDYSVIGHEGYRRMLNDTSSFQEANGALISIMDNPSKYKEPGEIYEAMAPFVSGTGSILGTEVGQAKGWIWLDSALSLFERGGNAKDLEKRIRQLPFVNGALEMLHRPNSEAQKFAGHEAGNWDMQKLFEAGEEAVHNGVISEEELEKWRKRYGSRLAVTFVKFLRAIFAGIIVGTIETGKAGTKDVDLE